MSRLRLSPSYGPTIRAVAISGRDVGSVMFGSLTDWVRVLSFVSADAIADGAAVGGMRVNYQGSCWELAAYWPGQALRKAA